MPRQSAGISFPPHLPLGCSLCHSSLSLSLISATLVDSYHISATLLLFCVRRWNSPISLPVYFLLSSPGIFTPRGQGIFGMIIA